MDMKEIIHRMRQSFSIIFTGIILAFYVFQLIPATSKGGIQTRDITAILILTVITDAMHLVMYSKKELNRRQLLLRYALVLVGVLAALTATAIVMRWAYPFSLFEWVMLWASAILIFAIVSLKDDYQTRKLANTMMEKLRTRYQG